MRVKEGRGWWGEKEKDVRERRKGLRGRRRIVRFERIGSILAGA